MSNNTETRINGRNYTVETATNFDQTYTTRLSIYGEVTLRGVRGAEYQSERYLDGVGGVVRFWNDKGRNILPSPVFDGAWFTVEADGTVRPATYQEANRNLQAAGFKV